MMSSAAAGIKAFGLDRGLPFPLADIAHADAILLVGSNLAETMPPILRYFEEQRRNGGRLILVDPRRSLTAQNATLHLPITPGTDAALANGLLHLLIREGRIDESYVAERTVGFEAVRRVAMTYWPERVERITGIPEAQLGEAARLLGSARTAMILTARGPEQQSHGVDNVLGFINLALALGLVGRPYSGYGCLTGQGNGQGGREYGQKADQLPGYRRIDNPNHRREIAAIWGIDEAELPGPGRSAFELLASLGQPDGVRGLLVLGSNPVVSGPHAGLIAERLRALDFLVVADFFLSETAQLADLVLPATQWAEETGTLTNLEGRVILRRQAVAPPPNVWTDLAIIRGLAERLGKGRYFAFVGPEDVFAELRWASAGGPADYTGITYDRIGREDGVFWPCPSLDHPGTPRLFEASFPTPDGKARFHPVEYRPTAEQPDAEFPLYLTTGRVLAQYQSGTQTRRVARLGEVAPYPAVEVHPLTARETGLREGDWARLVTRRGSAIFRVKLSPAIRPDTVFAPFHWGGPQAANRLTNPALDPVSRMPEFKVCAVRLEQFTPSEQA